MFIVIARTADCYGVVDTEDNAVEWLYANQLYQYIKQGIQINGVNADGSITVNPVYCTHYTRLLFGNPVNIFDATTSIRGGHNGVEFVVNKKVYKMRLLSKEPVKMGSVWTLTNKANNMGNQYFIRADMDGYLVKLSNGICTILPEQVMQKFIRYCK